MVIEVRFVESVSLTVLLGATEIDAPSSVKFGFDALLMVTIGAAAAVRSALTAGD
jgi:hypothetical protein